MSRVLFPLGDVLLEFEGDDGHIKAHPQTLTASVRAKTAKGRPGHRQHVSFHIDRSTVLKFALQMLELSDQMLPESLFLESTVIGASVALPRVTGHDDEERRALARICNGIPPMRTAAQAMSRLENLRKRMGVLRQVQRYLETCDDSCATNLQILGSCAERTGAFPFDLVVDVLNPAAEVQ